MRLIPETCWKTWFTYPKTTRWKFLSEPIENKSAHPWAFISKTVSLISMNSVLTIGSLAGRSSRAAITDSASSSLPFKMSHWPILVKPPWKVNQDSYSRRLGHFQDQSQQKQTEEDLEGEWEAPRDWVWFQVWETKINPVGQADTTRDHSSFDHDHLPTFMRLWCFWSPCWHRGCIHSIPETSDNSPNDEVGKRERSTLQRSTHDHDRWSKEDHLPSSKYVADKYGNDGSDETSYVITRYSDALNRGYMVVIWAVLIVDGVYLWELPDPWSKS